MDELVWFFHGGMVKENGEFENMVEDVELFDSSLSFKDLVDRVVSKHSCGRGTLYSRLILSFSSSVLLVLYGPE